MSLNSALAKLTATYTDSENEDKEEYSPSSETSNASIAVIRTTTPVNTTPTKKNKKKKKHRKIRRLVSYQDDTIVDEESTESDDDSSSSESDEEKPMESSNVPITEDQDKVDTEKKILEKYSHYKFKLPSKPAERPTAAIIEKITSLYEKMETKNMDMNKLIQERKEFRNPSIYEKLIEFCEIDEFGTNYPSDVYDPKKWKKSEMNSYLKLAEAQNKEIKKQKDRKNTVEVAKIPGSAIDEIPNWLVLVPAIELLFRSACIPQALNMST
ncbi:SAP30BP family protein [Megaselia abdita]